MEAICTEPAKKACSKIRKEKWTRKQLKELRTYDSSMNFKSLGSLALGNHRIVGYVLLAIALCFLIVPYIFFPQFYVPKADASMGYVAPASIEGVVFMALGITLLLVSIGFLKISPRD